MYPDFIGIGAQKSGTTWLHRNMDAHSQLWLPRKEVHYFDKKINDNSNALSRLLGKSEDDVRWRRQTWQGIKAHAFKRPSLGELRWVLKYYLRPYNDDWYGEIFEPKKGRIAGEITPAYSVLSKEKVAHIHDLMPDAKLIFMMRNPIERDWSQTVMKFDKLEKGSIKHMSEEEIGKKFDRKDSRLLTDYQRTLENWSAFYPEDQIFVGFLEDVHFSPEELLRSVFEFLGVDPSFRPRTLEKKIHSRSVGEVPTNVATSIARIYLDETEQLAERFGGHTLFWHYCAKRFVENPPEEESVPYPFWQTSLWTDWLEESAEFADNGSGQPGFASGTLSRLQAIN